jgi:hypothetical protein
MTISTIGHVRSEDWGAAAGEGGGGRRKRSAPRRPSPVLLEEQEQEQQGDSVAPRHAPPRSAITGGGGGGRGGGTGGGLLPAEQAFSGAGQAAGLRGWRVALAPPPCQDSGGAEGEAEGGGWSHGTMQSLDTPVRKRHSDEAL